MTSTQPPSYDGHKPQRDSQSILSTVLSISVTSSRNSRAHSCVCPRLFRSSSAWTHPARHQVCGHAYTCGNQAAPRIAHRLEQPAVVLVPGQRRLCASGQRLQRNRGCICLVQYQHVVHSLLRHCICGHVCGAHTMYILQQPHVHTRRPKRGPRNVPPEDASPDNLAIYLSKVRKIIINLPHGRRGKQSMYRRIVSEHQYYQRSSHPRTDADPRGRTKHSLGEKRRRATDPICLAVPLPTTRKRDTWTGRGTAVQLRKREHPYEHQQNVQKHSLT